MACAISGVVPTEPVVSAKTGHMYERKLIERHIEQSGVCPVTKQELTLQDLIVVKANPAIKPRAPSTTSIPSMIEIFQNEWDAMVLETFTLKQHIHTLRQELAHSLYQQDAACRVIARLVEERDEARRALGEPGRMAATPAGAPSSSSAAMEVEEDAGMSKSVISQLQATAKQLAKGRKKAIKTAIAAVAQPDVLKTYKTISSNPLHSSSKPGILCLDIHPTQQDLVMTGGNDSQAIIFNRASSKIVDTLKAHKKKVTDTKFHPTEDLVFTTSADNTAICWRKDQSSGKFSVGDTYSEHKDEVVGITIHPSGSWAVTASKDQTWAFHDIATGALRHRTQDAKDPGFTRVAFHPDGLILGGGTVDAIVRIFDVTKQMNVATFKGHTGFITGLSFSENGFYLASADDHGVVKLWDLRKLKNFHTITAPEIKSISSISFDASGSYLGVAGSDIKIYDSKDWSVVSVWKDHKDTVTDMRFGASAGFFASTSLDRNLKFYGV